MTFKDIDGSNSFFMGITSDNKLYINCPDYLNENYQPSTEITNVSKISAISFHWLAIDNEGTIYTGGFNNYGQITIPDVLKTLSNPNGIKVKAIATGEIISAAVGEDNKIYIWGDLININLPITNITYTVITPNQTVSNIYINTNNLIALDNDNKIILDANNYIYGRNSFIKTFLPPEIKDQSISYLTMNYAYAACICNNKCYVWGELIPTGVTSPINNVTNVAISSDNIFTLSS